MQSNHGGTYPEFQHLNGALPSPQDNRVTTVVHPANGIQNVMIVTRNPGAIGVTYLSVPWQQSTTRSQQNFQGLRHQLEFQQYGDSNNSHGAAAQTFHLQEQRSSVPEGKREISSPLLQGLLSNNPPDWKTVFTSPSSSSKRTHSNIEVNPSHHFSDETRFTGLQVTSSLAAPNCEQTRTHLMHSGETYSTPYQQHVVSPYLSSQSFTHDASATGEMLSAADNQMQDFNAKSETFTPLNNTNYGHVQSNRGWSSCTDDSILKSGIMPQLSVSHLSHHPTASASHNKDVESYAVGQRTAAVGQALQEDNSQDGKAKITPEDKETGDCAKSTPGYYSTECPRILMKAAATQRKNEEQRPVALTTLPGKTLDEVTEKHASSTFNRRASQEGHRSMGLNINALVGMDKVRSVSLIPKHKTNREKGHTNMESDNMQDVTGLSGYHQTMSSSVVSENKTFEHSKLNPSVDKILIHNVVSLHPANSQSQWPCYQTSGADAGGHVGSALSIQLAQNEVKEHVPLAEIEAKDALSVTCLKNPQYEDVSDEDTPQQHAKPPEAVCEDLSFAARFEDPMYEDVSEDENAQIENIAEEGPSLLRVPEHSNKQSPFKNKGYPHVRHQHCSCPCFAETDDALEGPLCHVCDCKRSVGWQTNHSAPCIPSSVLKDEGKADDQIDDDDDDWVVLPISMSDLKFEPDDEDQDWPGPDDCETRAKEKQSDTNKVHSKSHCPARKPEAASASLQLEVFDTLDSFLRAKAAQFTNKVEASDRSTPEHEMDSVGEPRVNQKRRKSRSEAEESCDTEDSCDYPSESESNHLTVSRKLLKKRSAPLPSKTSDSKSEKEGQHDEVTTVQKSQNTPFPKLRQLIAKARSQRVKDEPNKQESSQNGIIILDSDTEDESDQNCATNAKRCRLIHSGSEDSGDGQQRHSPESVDSRSGRFQEKANRRRPSPSDSPAPQHQSRPNDTKCEEVVPVVRSDSSHSTEKSGQNIQHKMSVQQNSKESDIIVLDSDMEDDNDEKCGNADMKELISGSEDSGDSIETVDSEDESAEESPSPAGPSGPRGDVVKVECSDMLHSTKKTKPLIEAAGGSENVQHKTNRQTVSEKVVEKAHFRKKRPHRKRILSSTSEDDSDDLIATKNRRSTKTEDYHCRMAKPKKPRVSREDAPKKRPQSVDKEAASSSSRDFMNPRVVLMEFSPASLKLKLAKESRLHMQAKDKLCASKIPTASGQKTDSCEKKTQNLHKKCTSKTKYANDATTNKVQTNLEKSRPVLLLSRQDSSASISRSSPTGGQLPESRQSSSSSRGLSQSGESSAASRLPASKQNTSIPRQPVLQRSHSHSGASTADRHHAPSKGPLSSAKKQVTADWQKSFSPTKRDRRFSLGKERDFHSTTYDSLRDTRPHPSRSDKSATPLMKKSKSDAIELTKAIRRDAPRNQGFPVGQGYKWSEKPAVTRTEGYRREDRRRRSPQRRHL